jgi:hypothetical protein
MKKLILLSISIFIICTLQYCQNNLKFQSGEKVKYKGKEYTIEVARKRFSDKKIFYKLIESGKVIEESRLKKSMDVDINDRRIYISPFPKGNDTIADGSEQKPYHTLIAASQSVYSHVNAYIEFMVDSGNWEWGLDEAAEFSRFSLTGHDMEIRGHYDTIIENVKLVYDKDTLNKYYATKNGVQLKEDSLTDYYIKDGKWHYPIIWNSAGTDSFDIMLTKSHKNFTGSIIRLNTKFTLTDEFALDFNQIANNRGTLNFNELIFYHPVDIEHERCLMMRKYKNCKFQVGRNWVIGTWSEGAINQFVIKGTVFENVGATDHVIRFKKFMGNIFLTRCLIRNKNTCSQSLFSIDSYSNSNVIMTDMAFHSSCNNYAMSLSHGPTIELKKTLLIKDCSNVFYNENQNHIRLLSFEDKPGGIYLLDTPSFFYTESNNLTIDLIYPIISNLSYNFYSTGEPGITNINKFNYIKLAQ